MSVSDRDKRILILFVGILIFVLVYYFPIRGYIDDTDKVKLENITLTSRLAELEGKVEKEAEIKADTTNYKAKIINLVSKFPSFLQTENEIMNMVELEKELKIEIPSITVNDPVEVQTSVSTDKPAPQPEAGKENPDEIVVDPIVNAPKYKLYSMSTSIIYKGGYNNLKEFLDKITESSDKKSLNTVSLTFDSKTGNLDGNIVYDSYFLEGSDRPYEEIITKTIKHGTKNIFGTVDAAKKKKSEDGENNEITEGSGLTEEGEADKEGEAE